MYSLQSYVLLWKRYLISIIYIFLKTDISRYLECQQQDWKEHKKECKDIAKSNAKQDQYNDHPFTFTTEVTSLTFNLNHFLKTRQLHKVGYWRTECECCFIPNDPFAPKDQHFGLPTSHIPPNTSLEGPVDITNWKEYYQVRGIHLDSPVALLLSFPLTVYHVIANLLKIPRNSPEKVTIHYIGMEKEICHLPIWKELLHLFPRIPNIDIYMIGIEFANDVPTTFQFEVSSRKLTIHLVKSLYHTWEPPEKPDVIFGLNSGLAAYSTWLPTLNLISKRKVPSFFTDYSEISCLLGVKLLDKLGMHAGYPININPFRSPAHRPNPAVAMPTYTNGFLYGI